MTRFLLVLAGCLLVLTVLAFWKSSRSEKRADELTQELLAARFNERGAKLYAESLERELTITERALALRDAQYQRVQKELGERKKKLVEIRDDACIDEPVPADLFSVQHNEN